MKNAEFAILSLIVEQPRHGYNIEQALTARGMRAWTEVGFSSIYYLLNKLEKQGLIASQLQPAAGKGPPRKIYNATQAGLDACQQATLDALAEPYRTFPPLMLGLATIDTVAASDAISALRQQKSELVQRLADVRTAQQAQPSAPSARPVFDYSIAMLTARINWLRAYITELEAGDS